MDYFLKSKLIYLYWTGIGSRKLPYRLLPQVQRISVRLEELGLILLSGGADGSDKGFEIGVKDKKNKHIILPSKGFNGNTSKFYLREDFLRNVTFIEKVTKETIPWYERLKPFVKKLMCRNGHQVLGLDGFSKTNFIVCYTEDGCEDGSTTTSKTGGTGQALRLAHLFNIPIFNLANADAEERLFKFVYANIDKWKDQQSKVKPYTWARRVDKGLPYYEVSTKGDKRFSAFHASLEYGTIEEIYQLDIKGYRGKVRSILEAKGKPPLKEISREDLYNKYKDLWVRYFIKNPELYVLIDKEASGKTITDMFATTEINQARAIADLLNDHKMRFEISSRIKF